MISVVVPAHDEERVIGRLLDGLLDGGARDLEVVVACNGCTDRTEQVARGYGDAVTVVSTPVASKIAALDLGDAAATGFPRCYVDADVEVTADDVRAVAAALDRSGASVAAPRLHVDSSESSWAVRSYYRVWTLLPSVRDDVVGRGFYALSADARARFGAWPQVIADDHFVRSTFARDERIVVDAATSRVRAPRTASALVARGARVRRGNVEVDRSDAAPDGSERGARGVLAALRRRPAVLPDLAVYLALTVAVRSAARRRASGWGSDTTTR